MVESIESGQFRLKVWGENACFTRPEMKVERVSYDVMTPSAARGILEAILWKPAIRWRVERIDVLKPIRWESIRRNEVGVRMSRASNGIEIQKERQQRAGLLLRDVAYVIHARFEMTERADPNNDSLAKFQEIFRRRAEKGQCFHRPYLGCREFAASFEFIPKDAPDLKPIPEDRDLGWMLYDMAHDGTRDESHRHACTEQCHARFFRAKLTAGRLRVPPPDSDEIRG